MSFELSRRRTLGLLASIAAPTTVAPASENLSFAISSAKDISIDDFLANASAPERARYHAKALAEAMGEIHPDYSWRSHVSHESRFCLVVGDDRPVHVVRKEA